MQTCVKICVGPTAATSRCSIAHRHALFARESSKKGDSLVHLHFAVDFDAWDADSPGEQLVEVPIYKYLFICTYL